MRKLHYVSAFLTLILIALWGLSGKYYCLWSTPDWTLRVSIGGVWIIQNPRHIRLYFEQRPGFNFGPENTPLSTLPSPFNSTKMIGIFGFPEFGQIDFFNYVIPFWLPTIIAAIPLLPLLLLTTKRRRWKRSGACLNCGYDLKNTNSFKCPECGERYSRICPDPTCETKNWDRSKFCRECGERLTDLPSEDTSNESGEISDNSPTSFASDNQINEKNNSVGAKKKLAIIGGTIAAFIVVLGIAYTIMVPPKNHQIRREVGDVSFDVWSDWRRQDIPNGLRFDLPEDPKGNKASIQIYVRSRTTEMNKIEVDDVIAEIDKHYIRHKLLDTGEEGVLGHRSIYVRMAPADGNSVLGTHLVRCQIVQLSSSEGLVILAEAPGAYWHRHERILNDLINSLKNESDIP